MLLLRFTSGRCRSRGRFLWHRAARVEDVYIEKSCDPLPARDDSEPHKGLRSHSKSSHFVWGFLAWKWTKRETYFCQRSRHRPQPRHQFLSHNFRSYTDVLSYYPSLKGQDGFETATNLNHHISFFKEHCAEIWTDTKALRHKRPL